MSSTILAATGANAYWFIMLWLICAAVSGAIANRKGYPEHWGLSSGLVLLPVAVLLWLVIPGKPNSAWKREGVFPPRRRPRQTSATPAAGPAEGDGGPDLTKPAG